MDYEKLVGQMKEVYDSLGDEHSKKIFEIRHSMLLSPELGTDLLLEYASKGCQTQIEKEKIYKISRPLRQTYLWKKRTFVIYGLGQSAREMFREVATRYPYKVLFDGRKIFFCEKDRGGLTEFNGYPVLSQEELLARHGDSQVLVATEGKDSQVALLLQAHGFKKEQILHREVFEDLEHQYFEEDIIQYDPQEVFVDAGALLGETSLKFLEKCQNQCKAIYIFEPNEGSFARLKEEFAQREYCHLFPLGLWNKEDVLCFGGSAAGGFGIERGEADIEISVNSLDQVLGDTKVTFLKMDIEGAELKALEGAKKIISIQAKNSSESLSQTRGYFRDSFVSKKFSARL